MASVYGLNGPLTYAQFFSLWLNTERIRSQRGFDAARAGWIVRGEEDLPSEWIEAATDTEESKERWHRWALKRHFRSH